MKKNPAPKFLLPFLLVACLLPAQVQAQTTCTVSVNQGQVINPASKKLLGVSFDARSSGDFNPGPPVDPIGYFDPTTGIVLPAVESAWNRLPVNGVRYPGNPTVLNWNWSYTIGPFADRVAQPMGPNGSNSQTLKFGFDEFMDTMTIVKGLPSQDVQIMVNLYPSVGQPNAATLAADWVEYSNQPHNGTNPRGGTNWAMLRDSFGHPNPYGIKIWNIGNEPWQPGELGNTAAGANAYIALAIPIIDSMLAVDPSLHITIAALGNSSSPWNSTLLASTALMSRIYGLSPHAFYDEDASTGNPSVNQVGIWLADLAAAAAAQGKKVVQGDQAHHAPNSDPDKAMRWEGALATANELLMVSQIGNVELVNFWIYGSVKATWHPIRQNAGGTYTFMAAAQVYEKFNTIFYDKSLKTTLTNASGGGPVPNARAAAFKSNDGSTASILVINTDLSADNEVAPPVLAGLSLQSAQLLSAPALTSDTFNTTVSLPLGNGNYSLPHTSILVFQFQSPPLAVEFVEPISARSEAGGIRVEWATVTEASSSRFEVERSSGGLGFKKIRQVPASGNSTSYRHYAILDEAPLPGLNYYRIRQVDWGGGQQLSKMVSAVHSTFEIVISPNPGKDVLRFDSEQPIEKMWVKNATSSVVFSVSEPVREFDLSGFPKGVYFLEFQNRQGQRTVKKVVRQ